MSSRRTARLEGAAHCGRASTADAAEMTTAPAPDLARWPDGWAHFAERLAVSNELDPAGRVWFPGNPYPAGHQLDSFSFGASLSRSGLSLEAEFRSVYYRLSSDVQDPEDLDDIEDWQAVGAWVNYSACHIGATFDDAIAGPIDLTGPLTITADHQPGDVLEDDYDDLTAWACYILGHDSVTDHRLILEPNGDGTSAMQWDTRVAMTYVGDDALDHIMWVEHGRVPPLAITVKGNPSERRARKWLDKYVTNPDAYDLHDDIFHLRQT